MSANAHIGPIGRSLENAYSHVQNTHMLGLPIVNPALRVEAVGLREWDGLCVGVIVTPWCMNVFALSLPGGRELPPAQVGTTRAMDLPTGSYGLLTAHLPQVGHHLTGSLFSPMDAFASQEQAVAAARDALALMFDTDTDDKPAAAQPEAAPAGIASRRGFLLGRSSR